MLFWTIVQTLILHRLDLNWELSFFDAVISAGLLAFFCFDLIIIFSFYQPGKDNHFYRFAFAIIFAFIYCFVIKWILINVLSESINYNFFVEKSIPIRFAFSLLVFMFVTAAYWLANRLNMQREEEKNKLDAKQLAKESELSTLRQQLQPHFLFNSLNSISALALSSPEEARKMIQQLSDFLRGTLKKDEQKFVSLKDELAHLNLYLEIEKIRFGHRLKIDSNFDEHSIELKVPPLLIQPIVENAIKFGLYDTLDATTITINTSIENNYLIIKIKNPFDTETQYANKGTGFGLNSIQRRLFLLYARNDLLITEKKQNQFITILKIPQQ